MSNLAGLWADRIFGTNTGNILIEFSQDKSELSGRVRINDDRFGISIFTFTGTETEQIVLNCSPEQIPEGIEVGDVTVIGKLQPDGVLASSTGG